MEISPRCSHDYDVLDQSSTPIRAVIPSFLQPRYQRQLWQVNTKKLPTARWKPENLLNVLHQSSKGLQGLCGFNEVAAITQSGSD